MILQALYAYYERMSSTGSSEVEPEGYKLVAIPFIIVLKKDGRLAGIDDTRSIEGKRKIAPPRPVPKIFEGSRTSNVKANLLWDKASYIFGVSRKAKTKRLEEQREKFLSIIREYFPDPRIDEGVTAIMAFLEQHANSITAHPLWEEISKTDPNMAFRLEGQTELICNQDAVKKAIQKHQHSVNSQNGTCLVTGKFAQLTRLENPIKGLRFSGKAESHLVSFNEPAYWSYGKIRGANAPIGMEVSSAYVSAINYLRREDSRQQIWVGNTTTIFWAARETPMENWFTDFFGEPAKGEAAQDNEAIRALYRAPQTGAPPLQEDLTPFYVLGLAPNASRVAVRFWYAGTVGEVAKHIRQYFDDTAITHGPRDTDHLSLFRLLVSTAVQGKSENIQPNLAGEVIEAILTGTPYPQTLLASVLSRIRAEQSKKDTNGKSLQNVTYARASLIKAKLARDARYYRENKKEVGMSLDTTNVNQGYLLGRLFAVLEKAQEEANPNINATIRDRFYGAASSTPVVVFPHLMKLKNYHIANLENRGRAVNLEKLIGEIIGGFADFPSHLSLADQGRFAIGYYHQRQDFFTKKDDKDPR